MNETDRPVLDVYLAAIPANMEIGPVYPPERGAWIEAPSGRQVRLQRYAVWKLLGRAVEHSFALEMEDLSFTQRDGKWRCGALEFSLSHSGRIAAAAVSSAPVGVDVESLACFEARGWDDARLERIIRRICTREECAALRSREDFLRCWTRRESVFKCVGGESPLSRGFDPGENKTASFALSEPLSCVLSVCGGALDRLRLFLADDDGVRPIVP